MINVLTFTVLVESGYKIFLLFFSVTNTLFENMNEPKLIIDHSNILTFSVNRTRFDPNQVWDYNFQL